MRRRLPLPNSLARRPFAVSDALREGISERRLRDPELARPFRGTRAVPQSFPAPETRAAREQRLLLSACAAYALRLRAGEHFSHQTAARLWGCPLPTWFSSEPALHVAISGRAARGTGVVGHHTARPAVVERHGLPVSDPASTWIALASVLPLDDLVAAGDHLILDPRVLDPRDLRPYLRIDELESRLRSFHGRGARSAKAALPLLRQGAESRPETLVRLLLVRAGYPEPVLQAPITDDRGKLLGYADLYWPEFKIVVEYDGQHHRTDDAAYDRDITRIDDFIAAGNIVVRIRKRGLFTAPAGEVARVERAFRERLSASSGR